MAWKFHYAVWNGVTVSVMPFSTWRGVVDSNVGVVVTCEHLGRLISGNQYEHMDNAKVGEHGELICGVCGVIPASVITSDKKKPKCDFTALAQIVGGEAAEKILSGEAKITVERKPS